MGRILKYLLVVALFGLTLPAAAQELDCQVSVNTPQLRLNDPKIFRTLENTIRDFMNNTKWTNDQFAFFERIAVSIAITIDQEVSNNEFKATITVQSYRPVFNSTYNTTVFSHVDKDFHFFYNEFDPITYVDEVYNNELSAVLAFYAYTCIGLDYDTFSPKGGTAFHQKAQSMVNGGQASGETGWLSSDRTKSNRYWLNENLTSPKYDEVRMALYKYHRLGLDVMYDDLIGGRQVVVDCLKTLQQINRTYPNAMFKQRFFNAKWQELGNMFSTAPPEQKKEVLPILLLLDPNHTAEYSKQLGT